MIKRLLLIVLFLATPAWGATIPDRRISDAQGDVLKVNSDGSIPVTLTGISGLPTFGGATTTSGNLLIADGNAFNSVALSGDVTVDGAGVATIPTGQVLLSEINGIDSSAVTTTAGRILIGNGTSFTSIVTPLTFSQNSEVGLVMVGASGNAPDDLLTIRGTVNGTDAAHTNGQYFGRDSSGVWRYECVISGFSCNGWQFSDDATSSNDTLWQQNGDVAFTFSSNNAAEVRVGIGVTNPLAAVDVLGHIRATGWTATSGRMLVGNSNEFNSVALSGDATITSTGTMTIGSATVTTTSGNLLTSDGVKFNSVAVGSGMGTRVATGANAACSTTCGALSRCFYGLDLATGLLDCANTASDSCFCGP